MKKNIFLAVGVLFMTLTLHAQQYDTVCTMKNAFVVEKFKTFTDSRDGNVYKYVTIGNQVWMAENLKYLPSVVEPSTSSITAPCYYVYDYDGIDTSAAKATDNYNTYGVLYNWPAAMAGCPAGWHLPSDAEWTQLTNYLSGEAVAGLKLKETGTMHWNSSNEFVTNETGFTALPGGLRDHIGDFAGIGSHGFWWSATATEDNATYAWYRYMLHDHSDADSYSNTEEYGFSVRCVRD